MGLSLFTLGVDGGIQVGAARLQMARARQGGVFEDGRLGGVGHARRMPGSPNVDRLLAKKGCKLPIWMTETGAGAPTSGPAIGSGPPLSPCVTAKVVSAIA